MHDSQKEVRVEAFERYKLHPKAFDLSEEQETVVMRYQDTIFKTKKNSNLSLMSTAACMVCEF